MGRKSRAQRWAEAVQHASIVAELAQQHMSELNTAIEALVEIQGEYEEWKDNLPDNQQDGATAEKLEAVCELDLQEPLDATDIDIQSIIDRLEEAGELDLPLGFGRD